MTQKLLTITQELQNHITNNIICFESMSENPFYKKIIIVKNISLRTMKYKIYKCKNYKLTNDNLCNHIV